MKIIFVRHANAMDKKKFSTTGKPDSERPLTAKGLKDINRVGKILKKYIIDRVDVICSSSYLRAMQTAEVLGKIYKKDVKEVGFLCPEGNFNEMLSFIKKQHNNSVIIMVGHQPSMGLLISRLLINKSIPIIKLDKSGIAIVSVDKNSSKIVSSELVWLLQPDVLINLYFG